MTHAATPKDENSPAILNFTMTASEARQHLDNLERLSVATEKPGQEAIKALMLVFQRELEKSE
jgi:hypothetical protein